jgi:cytochrome b6-f complex iron-sulfur subunit
MDPRTTQTGDGVSRRNILLAGTGTALGGVVLAACGGNDSQAGGSAAPAASAGGGKGASGSRTLTKVEDVPVGGAVSATGSDGGPVIVSQPSAGKVVAFSAICTHMGCTVAPARNILKCPCHGSTYNLATGKNTGGPAPRPLARIPVKVEGGDVVET